MLTGTLQTWIKRQIAVRQRLERVCTSYLLFLMVVTTKHSLQEAARFSGLHPSALVQLNGDIFLFYNKSLGDLNVEKFTH